MGAAFSNVSLLQDKEFKRVLTKIGSIYIGSIYIYNRGRFTSFLSDKGCSRTAKRLLINF